MKLTTRKSNPSSHSATTLQLTESIQAVFAAYTEYQQSAAEERAKRQAIQAWESVQLEKIRERRDVALKNLDLSFDERAELFEKLFSLADQAIESGNSEMLASTLNSMTDIAKTNPLVNLAEANFFHNKLDDPGHVWEF